MHLSTIIEISFISDLVKVTTPSPDEVTKTEKMASTTGLPPPP